jgi:hypothetical protein
MKNLIFGTIATVSLTATAFSLTSESASAAALTGSFQLSSGTNTTLTLSKDSINFNDPSPVNQVFITPDSNPLVGETFLSGGFNLASIKDISLIPSTNSIPKFLDLGKSTVAGSITNNLDVFNLEQVDAFQFSGSTGLVNIDLNVHGTFVSATGEESIGSGKFTFQYVGKLPTGQLVTPAKLQNYLNAGNELSGIRFSGAAFAIEKDDQKTPEPSAMLGLLGLTGFGFASFRQKRATK